MQNKSTGYGVRRMNSEEAQVLAEHNFRHVDQIERWKQEYERYTMLEENLASLSKLSYDPVDYAPMLVPVPWSEQKVPDFSFLVEEARTEAESKFFVPIVSRLAGAVLSTIILFFSSSVTFMWVAGILTIVLLAGLFLAVQQRYTGVEAAVDEARTDAEARTEQARQAIEEAKKKHEQAETERIALIERLLSGDIATIFLRLDNVLPRLGLPVPVEVNVDIYDGIPLIRILLPPKSVIPGQSCAMLSSGRLKHTEKEGRTVNKQYIELCAAVIMQVMSAVYANIPSFDRGYARGLIKNGADNDCLFEVALTREELLKACRAEKAITAVQQLTNRFETDTMLSLKVLEPENPAEWENVPQQLVRSMHINLSK